ncbi:uncharacterized protein TRAVEDRAFT_59496 [Trametes versicolor FP-101664 SS1]|uniref:uncharacterized protein n=1 Tax=Trametes versicolor (strain FP-101664) TaxID=717944 RepID=UPI000462379C|nr:uncharacterized protein TRAVEDRAFT_59496 [Trametes versicolor FP-101664 SS1]EIW56316.1 hypothetical protein TRAVEDRAFT_59496 [Trametes versicolor FP-101664 SS1]
MMSVAAALAVAATSYAAPHPLVFTLTGRVQHYRWTRSPYPRRTLRKITRYPGHSLT